MINFHSLPRQMGGPHASNMPVASGLKELAGQVEQKDSFGLQILLCNLLLFM